MRPIQSQWVLDTQLLRSRNNHMKMHSAWEQNEQNLLAWNCEFLQNCGSLRALIRMFSKSESSNPAFIIRSHSFQHSSPQYITSPVQVLSTSSHIFDKPYNFYYLRYRGAGGGKFLKLVKRKIKDIALRPTCISRRKLFQYQRE